jgi:hypothetical protein
MAFRPKLRSVTNTYQLLLGENEMRFRFRMLAVLNIGLLLLACAARQPAQPTAGEPRPLTEARAAEPSAQPSTQPAPEKAEGTQGKTESGPVTIAVWDLDDLASQEMSQPELGELLASRVVETIQKKGGYNIIDRARLADARKELRVEKGAVTDPTLRLQLGRTLGAQQMVFGGYQVLEGKMKLELHLLEVESGRIIKSSQESAPASSISGWLEAAQKAAAALL